MTDKTALSVKPFRKKKCVRCRPKTDTLKKLKIPTVRRKTGFRNSNFSQN